MPIQGLNFTILASSEAHQSYQSTGSFIVYNPNDGVAFVATDRTANGLSWDYKVPSQSGGKFPGPINSYLSIYYLDQSGGGAPGQIVVYASPESVNIPYFWSIGRATQSQSSSLDIVGGPQPGNPSAGISRLWIDNQGHLHILQSTGADYPVLDANNYASFISLVGDVIGPLNNTTIQVRNTSQIGMIDGNGTYRNAIKVNGTTYIDYWNVNGGQWRILNQAGTAALFTCDNGGNVNINGNFAAQGITANTTLNVTGAIAAGGQISSSVSIVAGGNLYADGSFLYLRGDGVPFVNWDGTYIHFSHSLVTNGNALYFINNSSFGMFVGGAYLVTPTPWQFNSKVVLQSGISPAGAQSGILYWHNNETVYTYLTYPTLVFHNCGIEVDGTNNINAGGSVIANAGVFVEGSGTVGWVYRGDLGGIYNGYNLGAWSPYFNAISGFVACNGNTAARLEGGYVISCYGSALGTWVARSDRKLKTNLVVVPDAACLAEIKSTLMPVYSFDWLDKTQKPSSGFMADELHKEVPSYSNVDENGEANAINYSQMVPTLWAAMRSLLQRVEKLEGAA